MADDEKTTEAPTDADVESAGKDAEKASKDADKAQEAADKAAQQQAEKQDKADAAAREADDRKAEAVATRRSSNSFAAPNLNKDGVELGIDGKRPVSNVNPSARAVH